MNTNVWTQEMVDAQVAKVRGAKGKPVVPPADPGTRPARPKAKKSKTPSKADLAMRFQCQALGLPEPVPEFVFHPTRKWRFDFAFVAERLALEIDGGVFMDGGGRHSRGAGYRSDCEKLAEAAILGWRVIRCLPEQVIDGTATLWVSRCLK